MPITVKLKEDEKEASKKFPKIMRAKDGTLVLFRSPKDGINLNNLDDDLDCWNMDVFKDYNEPVVLQNEKEGKK